ncbi:MAG: triose-phosphate isomerase [Rhodocyclaceae bacterium]|nr:triose-phosphate isomerase [Rhodocyclaceae bacterium]
MPIKTRQRFVVGNWKLNGNLAANAALLEACLVAETHPRKVLGVCVPFPYFGQLQLALAKSAVRYGAQDVSRFDQGAFTGEVSAAMVAEFGCQLALVGHSERRALFGDSDEVVAEKFGRAKQAGLTPILCVGETIAEREAGITEVVVARQVTAVVQKVGIEALAGAVLAYEPVWAIGTGKTASPAQAQEVHGFLRSFVAKHAVEIGSTLPILYGGSVRKSNAAELFGQPDIDGGLVGGASLVADEFLGIWQAL